VIGSRLSGSLSGSSSRKAEAAGGGAIMVEWESSIAEPLVGDSGILGSYVAKPGGAKDGGGKEGSVSGWKACMGGRW
jgi:hypothetical protein